MRSQGQGLMATLLMFVPLLAVPIVATLGVPWLAAKAKNEGLPLPDLQSANGIDTGVGQSRTARHSADDLFAPVLEPPAVDLRMSSHEMPQHSTGTAAQNPHLKNASLVLSEEEAWNDPFANLPERKSSRPAEPRPAESLTPPQVPESWTIKDTPPETPGESVTPEAPLPQEFPESANEEQALSERNPFAEIEPEENETSSPAEEFSELRSPDPEVTVGADAFEDPVPAPRVNRDPKQFDASRELFFQAPPDKRPSSGSMQTAEVPPPSIPPAGVQSNSPSTLRDETPQREPLTWDTARARLKEYGITHFYLQPDAKGQVFHFRCAYSPGGNSRINRLFEAEAPNPLEAVAKVLAQLDASNAPPSVQAN